VRKNGHCELYIRKVILHNLIYIKRGFTLILNTFIYNLFVWNEVILTSRDCPVTSVCACIYSKLSVIYWGKKRVTFQRFKAVIKSDQGRNEKFLTYMFSKPELQTSNTEFVATNCRVLGSRSDLWNFRTASAVTRITVSGDTYRRHISVHRLSVKFCYVPSNIFKTTSLSTDLPAITINLPVASAVTMSVSL
jgi:excinuclease UvrABC helicase subunit UvrB